MMPSRRALCTGAMFVLAVSAAPLAAQLPATPPPSVTPPGGSLGHKLRERLSGDAQVYGEAYGASGIDARRPGGTLRASFSPQLRLIWGVQVGMDFLVSTEGAEYRQSINQYAINPTWSWGSLQLGDFSQSYTPYTVQGLRIRGGGVDLHPRALRFAFQGGRTQDQLPATPDGLTYRRTMLAGKLGWGREGGAYIDLHLMHARDDAAPTGVAPIDTIRLDTIPVDVRPQARNRPQENFVAGLAGRLPLFANAIALEGEVSGTIITRDLTSPDIVRDSVSGGSVVGGLAGLKASTSADLAYNIKASYNGRRANLRVGYEQVGAGYTSLGVAYLINDRKAWSVDGGTRFLAGRVALQARYQHQNDNLLGQKMFTTNRDAILGSMTASVGQGAILALTGMVSLAANDAANDTLLVDNRALSLTSTGSMRSSLAGLPATLSLSYGYQQNEDHNVMRQIPRVGVHNAIATVDVAVLPSVSIAPSISAALTRTGAASERNVQGGIRATGRFLENRLTTSGQIASTFSAARRVSTMIAQVGYAMPWDTRFSLQARRMHSAAFGARPAFSERTITTTLSRSF